MSKQKITPDERIEKILFKHKERKEIQEQDRKAREKLRSSLDEFACELELVLEKLKGLPFGDQEVNEINRSTQSHNVHMVRVLVGVHKITLIGFTVHIDPATTRRWYCFGSQTVTAEEALNLALDEIERGQR